MPCSRPFVLCNNPKRVLSGCDESQTNSNAGNNGIFEVMPSIDDVCATRPFGADHRCLATDAGKLCVFELSVFKFHLI